MVVNYELLLAVGTGLGALVGGYGLGKTRIPFRRNGGNGNGNKCKDTACHESVKQHGKDIEALKKNINKDIFPKINRTAEDVQYIKGRIDEALRR